ncbi:MAG: S1 RNA-binding domain-containing protein [Caldilineae bacterium]|nr:S1 RNA-binding domain-containing protein [Chloroflexota bacterium]MCB9176643.1 S1 RNA-binding domain-containing protein [Caldilineae bacterium]
MSKLLEAGGMSAQALEDHPMFDLLSEVDGHREFKRGDIVSGTIALVGANELLIDVGGKFEGLLAPREFAQMSNEDRASRQVGDEVEVFIVNPNSTDGHLLVSLTQVRIGQDWDDAEALLESGESFEGKVASHNKGGLIVYIGQVRGFIPVSQLDRRHAIDRAKVDGSSDSPLARFVGEPLFLKVIELDRQKNRLILSEQAAMRERRKQLKSDLLSELAEGLVIKGRVTSLADFGAFVDIGGADGLVHLSELSWNRVSHPSEVLALGDPVEVKVISVDRERNRIGLSLKQLQPEPWSTIDDRYQVGEVIEAEITRLADFGAFAKLESDIEGLIHVSELSDEELAPGDVVSPGQRLTVRIIRIDPERKRIGLSLKRAGADFDALGLPYEDDIEDRSADDGPDGATEAPASIEMEAGSDPADASEPSLVAEPTGD